MYSCIACLMDYMFSIVKLLNCNFQVWIYIILVLPSSAVLKPAQADLVLIIFILSPSSPLNLFRDLIIPAASSEEGGRHCGTGAPAGTPAPTVGGATEYPSSVESNSLDMSELDLSTGDTQKFAKGGARGGCEDFGCPRNKTLGHRHLPGGAGLCRWEEKKFKIKNSSTRGFPATHDRFNVYFSCSAYLSIYETGTRRTPGQLLTM